MNSNSTITKHNDNILLIASGLVKEVSIKGIRLYQNFNLAIAEKEPVVLNLKDSIRLVNQISETSNISGDLKDIVAYNDIINSWKYQSWKSLD